MSDSFVNSDSHLLDQLRKQQAMTVAEMAEALGVTATAVRQRLNRLLAQSLIERTECRERSGRGRPVHRYALTSEGRRKCGSNFDDLAVVLWQELRAIQDVEVRRGLLQRLSQRLAAHYGSEVDGDSLESRMDSIARVFASRDIPVEIETREGEDLPVLTVLACPYPDLAEQDRGVCAMERMMVAELVGENVKLDKCRIDGDSCCTFQPESTETTPPASPAS